MCNFEKAGSAPLMRAAAPEVLVCACSASPAWSTPSEAVSKSFSLLSVLKVIDSKSETLVSKHAWLTRRGGAHNTSHHDDPVTSCLPVPLPGAFLAGAGHAQPRLQPGGGHPLLALWPRISLPVSTQTSTDELI